MARSLSHASILGMGAAVAGMRYVRIDASGDSGIPPPSSRGPLGGVSIGAPARPPARAAPRAAEASRGPAAVERACDGLLELAVAAFAAWTVIYHVCAVLELHARWAALAGALVLVPCGWAVWRTAPRGAPEQREPAAAAPAARTSRALPAAALATALAGAVLFAAEIGPWSLNVAVWLASAALAMAATTERAARPDGDGDERRRTWLEPLVVGGWAVGLAVLSLFILAPDADDSYYVHLSTWIAEHGRFPVRDVLFSDHVFPSLYFPPVPSYEALVGTVARVAHVPVPDVEYLVVPPVATVLAVLALWRLQRAWRVPAPALAVSVSIVFLLFAAAENRMLGGFFVSRLWQGKVVLLCVLLPVLVALLQAYGERPTRRGLVLLACATVAGVGLSTTAIFVIPVLATACLAPMAMRAPRAALAGWLAAVAYPAGAALVTLALDGRQPEVYKSSDLVPITLAHYALGTGAVGFIAMLAVLAGPVLLRSSVAGQMLASAALAVGILYVPHVPLAIFDLTDLGRVLWRLMWVMPVAALVGRPGHVARPARRPVALAARPGGRRGGGDGGLRRAAVVAGGGCGRGRAPGLEALAGPGGRLPRHPRPRAARRPHPRSRSREPDARRAVGRGHDGRAPPVLRARAGGRAGHARAGSRAAPPARGARAAAPGGGRGGGRDDPGAAHHGRGHRLRGRPGPRRARDRRSRRLRTRLRRRRPALPARP